MSSSRVLRYVRMALELAALTSAITLVALYAQTAALLPRPYIPYDADGVVGTYGLGTVLTALFAVGAAIMGFLIMLSRFPKLYRSPVELNSKNIEIQYILAKIMLSALQIVCALYFSYLMVKVYNMQIQLESAAFRNLSAGALVLCGAIYAFYLAAAAHYK